VLETGVARARQQLGERPAQQPDSAARVEDAAHRYLRVAQCAPDQRRARAHFGR
jgi:hypothetical protein